VRFKLERNPTRRRPTCATASRACATSCPTAIDEPVIAKVEADANPIIWLAFSSDKHSPLEVTDVANRVIKPRLQTLPGAADVRVFGERKFAMRIWLDRDRLAAYNLTVQDVEDAIRARTSRCRPGASRARAREFTVVAQTDLSHGPSSSAHHRQAGDRRRAATRCASATSAASRSAPPRRAQQSSASTGGRRSPIGVIKQAVANPLELSRACAPRCRSSSPTCRRA
jgi:multidrug efflux pump